MVEATRAWEACATSVSTDPCDSLSDSGAPRSKTSVMKGPGETGSQFSDKPVRKRAPIMSAVDIGPGHSSILEYVEP